MSEHFSTSFNILSVDSQGKKFDKVSRALCKSLDQEALLEFDYNTDLINLRESEEISILMVFGNENVDFTKYTYGTYGKLFKIEENSNRSTFYVSFGGLLLKLESPSTVFPKCKTGTDVRFLIKQQK